MPANAIYCQHKPPHILNSLFVCLGTSVGVVWCLLVLFGVCWCLLLSWSVPRNLKEVSESIWVKCMYVCWVWMHLGMYRSGKALNGAANALYRKSSKRQNSHTLRFWNIKIPKPPYISSLKIIGLLHFLEFLGPSEKNYNLQSLMITL